MALLVQDARTENFSQPPPKKKWIQNYMEKTTNPDTVVDHQPELTTEDMGPVVQGVITQFKGHIDDLNRRRNLVLLPPDIETEVQQSRKIVKLLDPAKNGKKFNESLKRLSWEPGTEANKPPAASLSQHEIGGVVQSVISQFLNGSIDDLKRSSRKRCHNHHGSGRCRGHHRSSRSSQMLEDGSLAAKTVRREEEEAVVVVAAAAVSPPVNVGSVVVRPSMLLPPVVTEENGVLNLSLPKNLSHKVTFAAEDKCYSTDAVKSFKPSKSEEMTSLDTSQIISNNSSLVVVNHLRRHRSDDEDEDHPLPLVVKPQLSAAHRVGVIETVRAVPIIRKPTSLILPMPRIQESVPYYHHRRVADPRSSLVVVPTLTPTSSSSPAANRLPTSGGIYVKEELGMEPGSSFPATSPPPLLPTKYPVIITAAAAANIDKKRKTGVVELLAAGGSRSAPTEYLSTIRSSTAATSSPPAVPPTLPAHSAAAYTLPRPASAESTTSAKKLLSFSSSKVDQVKPVRSKGAEKSDRKVDWGSAGGKKPASNREMHNRLEKNRRAHLKHCFDQLASECELDPKKSSNLAVIKAASKYITALRRKDRENEKTLSSLVEVKIKHQQQLSRLTSDYPDALAILEAADCSSSSGV